MHAYLFRSKRSPLNANLARLRRSDPLFRRPALNRIYIYISRLIGDDSANRESIKQIVFGRPTRLFFRPIGVAFLLERLLVISSATPAIEFEERGDPRGDGLGRDSTGTTNEPLFITAANLPSAKFRQFPAVTTTVSLSRVSFFLPLPFCPVVPPSAFDLGEAHNLIRQYKPAYQFDDENLVFPFRVPFWTLFPNLVYFFERGNYAG